MAVADTAHLVASLELKDKFSRPAAQAERAMDRLDRKSGTLGKTLGKGVGNAWQNTQRGIVIGAGAAAGAIGYAVTKAISFEDAFAGVKKTINEADLKKVGLSFDSLSGSLRQMAREIPISADELSNIAAAAGALGIRAQDISGFTEVVAKLSVTTQLTSDDASTALGHLGNVLHLTGDDFDELADSLVNLGNNGASTEPEIIAIAERFGAAGKAAGLTKEDILALASTTASMGIQVEAGGSALSRVFNNIATGIGTGSSKAKAFAKSLGLSAGEFRRAWEKDAVGTFDDFLERLSKLDQFDQAALLKGVGITNTRDVATIRALSGGYKELTKQQKIARNSAGAMDKEAAQRFATTKSQLQLLKQNADDAAITIGSALLPGIVTLAHQATDWIQNHQPAIKKFADDLAAGLKQAVTWASKLDWNAIGNTLKTVGGVGKTLLETFLAMPPWVQAAVATGWGLNKFTGGAFASIVGQLGSGLIKGVLGMNAGVVNINAGVVNGGGGVPGTPGSGGGGLVKGAIKFVLPIAAGVVIANAIREVAGITPEESARRQTLGQFGPRSAANVQPKTLAPVAGTLGSGPVKVADPILAGLEKRNASEYNRTIRSEMRQSSIKITRGIERHAASERGDLRELQRTNRQVSSKTAQAVERMRGVESASRETTGVLRRKNFSPKIDVEANFQANITVNSVTRKVVQMQRAAGRGFTSTGLIQ